MNEIGNEQYTNFESFVVKKITDEYKFYDNFRQATCLYR